MKAQTRFSLKDQLFNSDKVAYLTGLLQGAWPDFPAQRFREKVVTRFPELELKERITHMSQCLQESLPSDYPEALLIILEALPAELDPNKTDNDFGDFIFAPLSHFVALYGCQPAYLQASLDALRAITKRFSAEDAIRYFINAFPAESMAFLQDCTTDTNYHVRRLASEGSRPQLPWSQKLAIGHQQAWPILDALHADPTRYVTRSVANHLNDISKINPQQVIERLQNWQALQQQQPKELGYITRHALRTLVKKGDPQALALLGFNSHPDISPVELTTTTPQVNIGDSFEFFVNFSAHSQQSLLIDYVMKFANNHNKPNQKVFKLKQLDAKARQIIQLSKKHPMRLMTTRNLIPGTHHVTLQINGRDYGSLSFELLAPVPFL